MKIALGILIFLLALGLIFFSIVLYCFLRIFYVKAKKRKKNDEIELPSGRIYEVHRETLTKWIKAARSMSHKNLEITSHDGLTLRGRYYEYKPGAPIELMLHGYRGNSERDLSGGVLRAFAVGHNVLVVDNRGCGRSDGYISTFGVLESKDCLLWVEYIIDYIDFGAKIILTGVSMGAATVILAACSEELPDNVVGVLADCGYTSGERIISKVVTDMGLPARLVMPFVRIGAKLFGKFDLRDASPIDAIGDCSLPILFYHGDDDRFVPYEMSVENYEECGSEIKKLVTIEGSGHALCYVTNPSKYIKELKDFFGPITGDAD